MQQKKHHTKPKKKQWINVIDANIASTFNNIQNDAHIKFKTLQHWSNLVDVNMTHIKIM